MTYIPQTHTCPWCEGQSWELKTMNRNEEPRLKCDGCNAGFLISDLPECLSDDRRKSLDEYAETSRHDYSLPDEEESDA